MDKLRRQVDIPLVSVINYNGIPVNSAPIIYSIGDEVKFDIDINFLITAKGLIDLGMIVSEYNTLFSDIGMKLNLSLRYVYANNRSKITKYIDSYSGNIGDLKNNDIFKITNSFEINTEELPIDEKGVVPFGNFVLTLDWEIELSDVMLEGNILEINLPIFNRRRTNHEND